MLFSDLGESFAFLRATSSKIYIIPRTADFLGRRLAMTAECVMFIIGVIIQITATHQWAQFAVGRLISGFGIGALSAAVPMVSGIALP